MDDLIARDVHAIKKVKDGAIGIEGWELMMDLAEEGTEPILL